MSAFYRGTLEEMLKRTVGNDERWAVAFTHGTNDAQNAPTW